MDWSVNLGNILQIVVMAATVMWVFVGMRSEVRILRHDVRHIEDKLEHLSEAFSQLGTVLTQVAVQDTRLSMIEKNVDELRHGRGFVEDAKGLTVKRT